MSEREVLISYIKILKELGLKEDRYMWLESLIKSSDMGKGLSYSRIAELMGLSDPAIDDASKQKIKRHLKALEKFQSEKALTINMKLLDLGLKHFPVIESLNTGGGAGNVALFKIEYHPISMEDQLIIEAPRSSKSGQVEYYLKDIKKLNFFGQFLGKISIPQDRHYIYSLMPIFIFTVYLMASIYLLYSNLWFEMAILTLLVYSMIKIIEPFYLVLDKAIIKAPGWLIPLNISNAYLITRKVDTTRQIILSYYEGKCTICSGKLDIVEGKNEYKGRIIGQCENSGREHIFSFDHITKIGSPLRKEYSEFLKSVN
ncbi:MAG: hypothetical protein HWE39_24680 [Oceanospirillaceae bacterium]|nr:hypothetical protein [Oceanospirillaceae bacterium]